MLINPEDIPSVAMDSMNDTHLEEVAILNAIDDLITKRQEGEAFDNELAEKIDEWIVHTEAHFGREEEMMLQYGFPVYPVHKGEHDRVKAEAAQACRNWRTEEGFADLVRFVRETFPNWFFDHVSTMDMVTAQFIVSRQDAETSSV